MNSRKEVKRYKVDADLNKPYFYALPDTKALNRHNFEHELACAQVYVSYVTTGRVQEWRAFHDREFLELRLLYDRLMVLGNRIFFWEIDRGRETYAELKDKIGKYLYLGKLHPQRFHVIFATTDSGADPYSGRIKQTAESRKNGILKLYQDLELKTSQFLTTTVEACLWEPLGEIFESTGGKHSLETV